MPNKPRSNEIKIERIYDAPVKLVWDAWTDVNKVGKWWGPRGFTLTTHSKEFKVGGIWHYTMHGPDGTDYPNKTLYHVIEPLSKLVYDHGGYDDRPPLFRVTVNFKELAKEKTKMSMTMALATPEAAEETRKFIKKAGGEGTWDRLAEFLEKEDSGLEKFVINRSFEAPIETLYEMWTNPDHISKWLPPTGFTMKYVRLNMAAGNSSFYAMTNGKDLTLYGRIHYKEFSRPNRIVYMQEFCDENEEPSCHPMAPTWPRHMLTTVDFAEESDGRTRVMVTWRPSRESTPLEIETFVKMRPGMTIGWTGSFDKLEDLLKSKN